MDAFRQLIGAIQPKCPPPIESDIIYPVHMLDDTKTLRQIIVTWTLQFNDVLDADKLYASLSKLIETGDWRKLGGRLRLKSNGELEIHAPRQFTAERPAVSYSRRVHDTPINQHPLAKTLPKPTDGPSIHPGPGGFRDFAAREDAPATLQDYLYHDTPQLSLHVTSFNDATLVALTWPHTLMDVMGQQSLLRAWSLVLSGEESQVPPLLDAREDVMASAPETSDAEPETFILGKKQLSGLAMGAFGLRFMWDMLWNPVVETNTIFLPKKAMEQLHSQAQADLTSADNGKEKLFISEGDVLTAWLARAVASSLPESRPLTVLHPLNARFRLPSITNSTGLCVSNMALAAYTFLSPGTTAGSLGLVALENRRNLMEQSTQGQVLAFLRRLRQQSKLDADPATVLCGESNSLLMPFTNWTRADFFKVIDFSPAVVRAGETNRSRANPPGTIVYHHSQSMRHNPANRNVVVVLGKDHADNYWLIGNLLPQAWVKIRELIGNM